MGNLWIPVRSFLNELGLDVVIPPKNSKKTLDLGIKYSPEFACLPFKINLGNYIEAIDKGADTIIMGGGSGPCRFGYYGEVQQEILRDLDYQFEMIVIEPDLFTNLRNLRKFLGMNSLKKILNAGRLTWYKLMIMDNIHQLVLKNRSREIKEGEIDQIYDKFLKELDETMSVNGLKALKNDYLEKINNSLGEYKRGREIKIAIVGEIYLVIEPFVNLDIEKKLGKLGASVEKEIYISSWLKHFLHIGNEMELIEEAAWPYLRNYVGGHGIDSVGNAVRYARMGFDGVIHLAPFTCMPEIIAQTILPVVSKGENIPVLSLFFDEHTGDAGLLTRLEAFIDLLVRKREIERGSTVYG